MVFCGNKICFCHIVRFQLLSMQLAELKMPDNWRELRAINQPFRRHNRALAVAIIVTRIGKKQPNRCMSSNSHCEFVTKLEWPLLGSRLPARRSIELTVTVDVAAHNRVVPCETHIHPHRQVQRLSTTVAAPLEAKMASFVFSKENFASPVGRLGSSLITISLLQAWFLVARRALPLFAWHACAGATAQADGCRGLTGSARGPEDP